MGRIALDGILTDVPHFEELDQHCSALSGILDNARKGFGQAVALGRRVGEFTSLLMAEATGEERLDLLSARSEVIRAAGFLDRDGRKQVRFAVRQLVPHSSDLTKWRPDWRKHWFPRQEKLWAGLVRQSEESLERLETRAGAGLAYRRDVGRAASAVDGTEEVRALVLDFRARSITFTAGPSVHLNDPGLFLLLKAYVHRETKGDENGGALPFGQEIAGESAKKTREKLVTDFEKAGRAARDVKLVLRTRTAKGCNGYVLLIDKDNVKSPPPTGEVPFAPGVSPEHAERMSIRRARGERGSP